MTENGKVLHILADLDGKKVKRCQPSQTWNNYPEYIRSTETYGQFKTDFYELKLESYTSSTLNFAPNMF